MKAFLPVLVLMTVCVAAGAVHAQTQHDARDLSQSARASVAQTLYASTATAAAIERAADAHLIELRRQIDSMQARLDVEGQRGEELQSQITAARDRFIQDLGVRDHVYAQEIAIFRSALTNIASSPEGARALQRFNSGDDQGALAILDDLRAAHDRARAARTLADSEAENRRVAILSLEARARANLGARSVQPNNLLSDPQDSIDDAADALIVTGDLPAALRRLEASLSERALGSRRDDAQAIADIANLHDRIGDVASALADNANAISHYRAGLVLRRELVAASPNAPLLQRAIGVELYKLARTPGAAVSWSDVAQQFDTMNQLGILAEHDLWARDAFRARAAAEIGSTPP